MQLDRSCLLDLLSQELRLSLVTGLEPARASLTRRLAQASASQSLPSQLNRPGLVNSPRDGAEQAMPVVDRERQRRGPRQPGAPPRVVPITIHPSPERAV